MHARPHILTHRLRLRPYEPGDLDALHHLWTHAAVRRYLFDDEAVSRAWVREELARDAAARRTHGFGQWAFFLRTGSPLIGFGGFRHFFDPPQRQLLYGLHPDHWGQGLATEAARALIRYGFETHGFDDVLAATDAPNTASIRVMQKAGLQFHKQAVVDGLDTVYYTLHRADWQADDAPYALDFGAATA